MRFPAAFHTISSVLSVLPPEGTHVTRVNVYGLPDLRHAPLDGVYEGFIIEVIPSASYRFDTAVFDFISAISARC